MRHKKLTFALGLFVLSAARISVAAPLINEPLTDHPSHTFVLIGDANGGDGGDGGGDGGGA